MEMSIEIMLYIICFFLVFVIMPIFMAYIVIFKLL